MAWRRLRPAALVLAAGLAPALGQAQAAAEGPASGAWGSATPADARAWLQRIHKAANSGNYRGTLVFSTAGLMSSSRVWHYCVGDQTYEKLESLDGRQRMVIRRNDEVQTVWPQARLTVHERRDALPGWQTTPQRVDLRALEQYAVRLEGTSRVAGRDADVLLLDPRDTMRYAQRLWADRATGLMLRADVLGPAPERKVLESAAFSEVEIDVKPQPKTVMQEASRIASLGYRVLRPKQQKVQLEDEGWVLRAAVPGFALTGCIRRELAHETGVDDDNGSSSGSGSANSAANGPATGALAPPPGLTAFASTAAARTAAAPSVLQAVFSDGLAHVSVFIEPFDAQRHRQELLAHLGATSTVSLQHEGYWLTAVGDAPPGTLRRIAESLQRRR